MPILVCNQPGWPGEGSEGSWLGPWPGSEGIWLGGSHSEGGVPRPGVGAGGRYHPTHWETACTLGRVRRTLFS